MTIPPNYQNIATYTPATAQAIVDVAANDPYKEAVRVATAAALPANSRVGNVLTASVNSSINTVGIDGKTDLALNQRVLVKNEVLGANDGIYYVSALGGVSSKWSLTRATDADASAAVKSGLSVFVSEGTVNAGTKWTLTTIDPIVLNTTALVFSNTASSVSNATTGAVGVVQLAGDLAGTAAAPKVVSVNGIVPFAIDPAAAIAVANQATLTGLAQTIDGVALSSDGMRVYLAAQTTPAQNGFWVVHSGAWTRPTDWATGATPPIGTVIKIAPGGTANWQAFGGEWMVTATAVIDTGTVTAYPRICKGQQALSSGTPSTATVSSLWVLSATTSVPQLTEMTDQTKATLKAVLVAGAGSGSLAITGAATVTDTIAYLIINW